MGKLVDMKAEIIEAIRREMREACERSGSATP